MIHELFVRGFTVFREAKFAFAGGINVVIGSNGAGKSHVLKLAYTGARWSQEMALREKTQIRPDKATLQKEMAKKLMGVFRCEGVGRLSTRGQGVRRTEVGVTFRSQPNAALRLSFSTKSTTDVVLDKAPTEFFGEDAVFFPTKEMLTMFRVPRWLARVPSPENVFLYQALPIIRLKSACICGRFVPHSCHERSCCQGEGGIPREARGRSGVRPVRDQHHRSHPDVP